MSKREQKNRATTKLPSKLDLTVLETKERSKHQSSEDISRAINMLNFEHDGVEDEIARVESRLKDAKSRRSDIEAQLTGLNIVISLR